MSDTVSISAGIAARYATALFELANESGEIDALESDVHTLDGALADSEALQDLIASPLYARAETATAVQSLAKKMKLGTLMHNTLGLMAQKRRLFVLPAVLTALRDMIAAHKGEVIAQVSVANALSAKQNKELASALSKSAGKDVIIETTVDETLIGGMIVKLGSKMIDSSIKSKLANLQNAMKEVG